jgi:protein gp37
MAHHPNPKIAEANVGLVLTRANGQRDWSGEARLQADRLALPLRWKKPRLIFVNSLSDVFWERVPTVWIDEILTVMLLAPHHVFQILTKRPARMAEYLSDPALFARLQVHLEAYRERYPQLRPVEVADPCRSPAKHLWWGTSAETQVTLLERSWCLRQTPAAVRFLSLEPLLEELHLRYREGHWTVQLLQGTRSKPDGDDPAWDHQQPIHWVICGGESGSRARSCDLAWLHTIVEECQAECVPVWVKQIGRSPFWNGQPPALPGHVSCQPGSLDGQDGYFLDGLRHKAGANTEDWPEPLRVQQLPEGSPHAITT